MNSFENCIREKMDLCELLKPSQKDLMRKTLHCKKTYSPCTKVSGWQRYGNTLPIDNNSFCPGKYNLHLSHYNRLGWYDNVKWSTSTEEAMQQYYKRRLDLEISPNKTLVNLYTDISDDCIFNNELCSSEKGFDYITIMQQSYQPPYPYLLRRLSMPATPYFQNRRLTNTGMTGVSKFQDDDFLCQTKRLQMHKSARHVSYNPCTNKYSDGSTAVVRKSKCTELTY